MGRRMMEHCAFRHLRATMLVCRATGSSGASRASYTPASPISSPPPMIRSDGVQGRQGMTSLYL